MTKNFSVFVNTTDSFEDCWQPFFFLFKKFWPQYNGRIYLNTELKTFYYSGLNIISIKNGLIESKWTDCLIKALSNISDENVLYFQEDYFLHSPVNHEFLYELYKQFVDNDYDCLHLTDQCSNGPFIKKTTNEYIWEIHKNADYRISTQAAFWKRSSLIKIIDSGKTAWEFEHYSNENYNEKIQKVYCLNREIFTKGKNEIIPYIFTGIIKGKWNKQVFQVFKENGIAVNFKERKFYQERRILSLIKKLIKLCRF